jgi:3-hydroxyacyl-CoA dehydrogenase
MSGATVHFTTQGAIALATIENPPVNALSHGVRTGLKAALERTATDPALAALVILGAGRNFSAGADVREFGRPFAAPELGEVIELTESLDKPVIAALHGSALGGGLELALACHFRVALAGTRLGLPEVKLGIIPGGGGTQRLPRLIGARAALTMIAEGKDLEAAEAQRLGLIDLLVGEGLEAAAVAFAGRVVGEGAPLRRTGDILPAPEDPQVFEEFAQSVGRRQRGFLAPLEAVKAVRLAYELPFAQGLRRELQMCMALMEGEQSRAQRHAFAAEREIARIPGVKADLPPRPINAAAVVGAGVMGRGIALCFASAGIPVQLLARTAAGADQARAEIAKLVASQVKRGTLAAAQGEQRLGLITAAGAVSELRRADLIVEAISEDLAEKEALFAELAVHCRPGTILTSNTSFLDLNALARASTRAADFAGLHFFNPAHAMRLLEVVRTGATAPEVTATLLQLARRLGKVPVLVGAAEGFVANRMLARRSREALFMLEEGALPEQVDAALVNFGFPLGPFAVADLGGLDVVLATRRARFASLTKRERAADLLEQLNALGRLGQKTRAGWYRYDAERRALPDPAVRELITRHSSARGLRRRDISDEEIVERCVYAMINEGARLLGEGVVPRPQEIDVIWLLGFGFPAYRGGPMFHADRLGLPRVLAALERYRDTVGAEYFMPAPLLAKLAGAGRGFYDP